VLEDGQVWESDKYVFKIEKKGKSFQSVIFKKVGDKLDFVTVDYREDWRLLRIIIKSGATLTNKAVVLK